MSDALSRAQISEITHNLEAERKELLEQIRSQIRESEQAERFDRLTQLNDPGDYSVADVMRDMQLEQLDRETEHLQEIEDTEGRIQRGEYGQCADCGTDIKAARLLAQPTAKRCIQCQELFERTHATGHTSNTM